MKLSRSLPLSAVLMAMLLCTSAAQQRSVPPLVADFVTALGPRPTAEAYHAAAKEALWRVYPLGDSVRGALETFIDQAPEGPGVAFAALALISYRSPSSASVVLRRALRTDTDAATRWYLLNTAPYVLGMGDVFYMGDGNLDNESRSQYESLSHMAAEAETLGVGRVHAARLRSYYDQPASLADNPDRDLIVWHQSAYLLGTLDLRDLTVLRPWLSPDNRAVFTNVMDALSLATNRDHLAPLRELHGSQLTRALEDSVARATIAWWEGYLLDQPTGDWVPAVVSGFTAAGFAIAPPFDRPAVRRELIRALSSRSHAIRYSAYRILNHTFHTHFDLDRVLNSDKYAMSFLYPDGNEDANEARLRAYWTARLRN